MRENRRDQHKRLLSLAINGEVVRLEDQLSAYLGESPGQHVGDVVHPKTGDGLLHVAARGGHLPCLEYLLRSAGCGVDQRNLAEYWKELLMTVSSLASLEKVTAIVSQYPSPRVCWTTAAQCRSSSSSWPTLR